MREVFGDLKMNDFPWRGEVNLHSYQHLVDQGVKITLLRAGLRRQADGNFDDPRMRALLTLIL